VFDLAAAHVRDGESVLKVVHRPDAWANFPERAKGEDADDYKLNVRNYKRGADLPIAWRVVDRMCVVYEGGDYGDAWVIEYGEYTKPYLRNRYGMVDGPQEKLVRPDYVMEGPQYAEGMLSTSSGRSVVMQFFTSDEWHVLVDGSEAPGWPKPNPYKPHIPYFRAPAYDMESLLYSLLFLVPRLDELLTMKLNWSYLGAYPTPVISTALSSTGYLPTLDGPVGDSGGVSTPEKPRKLTWTPGQAMELAAGKTFGFVAPPPVGGDLNDLITIFKSLIDIAGIPSIMRGVSGSGDSGYLANQMKAAAAMAYKLSMLSLQRQLEKATEFSLWMVPNVVKQTVYVLGWDAVNSKTGKPLTKAGRAWLGISPDKQGKNVADYTKLGPVSYQYRPTQPTDEQANAMIALQLTNAAKPLVDRRHALETWLQEEDPEAILDALYVEQAMEEEPLRTMVMQQALAEAGIVPQQQAQQAAQLVDQYGNPMMQQPMSPGMAGVPFANQMPPGGPAVPGVNIPITPQAPQGVPGNPGGRAAGTFPGQPGGPQMR